MTFNIVFFLMIFILLGLIIYSKKFRQKEKGIMEAETNYIDAIKNYKENPIESLKVHAKNKGFEYGKRLGLSLEQTEEMIFNDFSKVK